jgi:hypothetical protein
MPDNISDEMGGQESSPLPVASTTRRDDLGFVTSAQPNLSLPQVQFILAAGSTGSNQQAADLIGVEMDEILAWMDDNEFRAVYHTFLSNKREGVKQIGSQLLPAMMLELTKILTAGNNKEKLTAAKLLAMMQGMLITQNNAVDKGAIEALREELMRPRPSQNYRTLNAKENS